MGVCRWPRRGGLLKSDEEKQSLGPLEVVTTLIAAKATLGVQDTDGRTEAMWAAKFGHSEAPASQRTWPWLSLSRLAVLLDKGSKGHRFTSFWKGFDLNVCDKFGLAVADHASEAERH